MPSIVLRDDNAFTADKMQMLCNSLCSSYARATRAVSVSHLVTSLVLTCLQIIPVAYVRNLVSGMCVLLTSVFLSPTVRACEYH
jgi:hypothetical protein